MARRGTITAVLTYDRQLQTGCARRGLAVAAPTGPVEVVVIRVDAPWGAKAPYRTGPDGVSVASRPGQREPSQGHHARRPAGQQRMRRVVARRPGDLAAWVRPGSAQVQALDRVS